MKALPVKVHQQRNVISELRRDSLLLSTTSGLVNEVIKATPNQIALQARKKLTEIKVQIDQREAQLRQIQSSKNEERLEKASAIDSQTQDVSFHLKRYREVKSRREALLEKGLPSDHPEMVVLKERSEDALREAHLEADAVEERLVTILDRLGRQSEQLDDLIMLLIEDRHGIASGPVVDLFKKRLQELREAQSALESLEDEATFLRDHLESSRPFLTIKSWNQK